LIWLAQTIRPGSNVYKWNGQSAVSILPGGNPVTSIVGLVTGSHDYQTLSLGLGTLTASPHYLELKFNATSTFSGTNTEEFLRAFITDPGSNPPALCPAPSPVQDCPVCW
jgi:hypothetical protein